MERRNLFRKCPAGKLSAKRPLGKNRKESAVVFVKVSYDELTTPDKLEYDVYTISGDRMYTAGTILSDTDKSGLRQMSLYRNDFDLPRTDYVEHEGVLYRFPAGLTEDEMQAIIHEEAQQPLLTGELATSFVSSVTHFWDRLKKGATPDIALCEVARDRMISEVTSRVDQIQYLSQVRVRDEFTYSHILDVTALSVALAVKAGFSKKEVREIALGAILHDLGKLMIPRNIMFKPSRLTEKEFQVMQLHPGMGYKIIVEELKLPEHIARPALEHQEMYSGGGYPQGLKKDEIHPYSHVVKIADVYDALTSKRPYKESIPSYKALQIMLSEGEKSFHPELLAQFVQLSNYHDFTRETVPTRREMVAS
jgi:HD-GYP domain-containing protein (c-di-GMP phosphodiesterase class II)